MRRRLIRCVVLVVLLTGCASPTATPDPEPRTMPAADPTEAATGPDGRELDTITVLPDEVDQIPAAATDEQTLDELVAAAVPLGAGEQTLRQVDLEQEVVIAFVVGECPTGTAELVVDGDEVQLAGRESDGVCDAVDEEIQLWAVTWDGLPEQFVVRDTSIARPA